MKTIQVIEPIWEARFIHTSFACHVGKGTHKALDQCHAWVRRYRYAFHGDVVKYFPSIDHQIMRSLLARRIADRQVMWLIDTILASDGGIQSQEYPPAYLPGDDLLGKIERQWQSNTAWEQVFVVRRLISRMILHGTPPGRELGVL